MTREEAMKQNKYKDNTEPELQEFEMKPGDYRIQVHILEAKDIKTKGKGGNKEEGGLFAALNVDAVDPMIEVEIMGQTKCTEYKTDQTSPIFNEMLFFEYQGLRTQDLETGMIQISLLDHDFIGTNNLLGVFTVDVSYIYRMNKDHELYRMWVALTDPSDETQAINGYVKLTLNVLGPGDKIPFHDPSKNLLDKNDNGVNALFTPSRVKLQGHQIKFTCYRAENLAPLDIDANNLDPYVKLSFAGNKSESKTVKSNRNPVYNQELLLACSLPTMNNQLKLEMWDDDFMVDKRVGTHFINFNDVKNKKTNLRWINFYGPPLLYDNKDYGDLMTLYGEKGSTYRGRLFYSLETADSDNPKTKTKDLNFNIQVNPSPNTTVKGYLLKIALYEGIELPMVDNHKKYAIVASCGPFDSISSFVEVKNSRAVWNEYVTVNIRAPEIHEDIPDVILYYTWDPMDVKARICFKRIKAAELLDQKNKQFNIEKYVLEEDKAIDALDDEQFPGIIYARMKLYSRDTKDEFPADIFRSQENYTDYLIQVHIYMGRDFPPADETGAADPFIVVRCQGERTDTCTKFETLNPGFFETVEMVVSLPPLGDPDYPQPGLSLLVFDEDTGTFSNKKDLLGRIWIPLEKKISQIPSPVDEELHTVLAHHEAKWYDLIFDATNDQQGQLLVGYDIIPMDLCDEFPLDEIDIAPEVIESSLSMAIIGIRDIVPSIDLFPVNKVFCKFDISGDNKHPIFTNKHSVISGSSNLLEVITMDIEVPVNLDYAPVLTVYVYDNAFGLLGERLVGVTNIPLHAYCKAILDKMKIVTQALQEGTTGKQKPKYKLSSEVSMLKISKLSNMLHDAKFANKLKDQMIQDKKDGDDEEGDEDDEEANDPPQDDETVLINKTTPTLQHRSLFQSKLLLTKANLHNQQHQAASSSALIIEPNNITMISKQDSEYEYIYKEREQKKNKQQNIKALHKKKVQEEEEKRKKELEEKETKKLQESLRAQTMQARANKKMASFMASQGEYFNEFPGEEFEKVPEWLVGRAIVEDELEDQIEKPPFLCSEVWRGQTRGKASIFSKTVESNLTRTCVFKNIIKIKSQTMLKAEGDDDFREYITPKNYVVRLYVLKGKSLTPKDVNTSDPYLIIKLGDQVIDDKSSIRPKTNNPGFFTSYDIPVTLPGASTLAIEVWDDDGFLQPDLIGITKIDLEDRFYSNEWRDRYPADKKPIEERTLFTPKSSAPQGVLQCWVEIVDPKVASSVPRFNIQPLPKEEFEVRVIVWGTRDMVIKDTLEGCNDLYLKGILNGKELETDTHWRCRDKGSFNWRWKFPISLPLDPDDDYGKDVLQLQMWDRDVAKANDMIGEHSLFLNTEDFPMLKIAYKKKQRVTMRKIDTKLKRPIDRFWVMFTEPNEVDEQGFYKPQGYAEISIEILPKGLAEESKNGLGRDAPNQYPVLPEPTGRFQFDLFSPMKMLKEIFGPALVRKVICWFCVVVCIFIMFQWGVAFMLDIFGAVIAKHA